MNKQTFENNLLETCNNIANLMYQEAITTNSELTFNECFEMATKITFKYVDALIEEAIN